MFTFKQNEQNLVSHVIPSTFEQNEKYLPNFPVSKIEILNTFVRKILQFQFILSQCNNIYYNQSYKTNLTPSFVCIDFIHLNGDKRVACLKAFPES